MSLFVRLIFLLYFLGSCETSGLSRRVLPLRRANREQARSHLHQHSDSVVLEPPKLEPPPPGAAAASLQQVGSGSRFTTAALPWTDIERLEGERVPPLPPPPEPPVRPLARIWKESNATD